MNFVSASFWLFFLGSGFCYFLIRKVLPGEKGRWDPEFLLLLSLFLFASESWLERYELGFGSLSKFVCRAGLDL